MRSFLTHAIGTALYATESARHAFLSLPAVVGARTALSNAANTVSAALSEFWQDVKEAQAYAPVKAASLREELTYASLSAVEAEVLRLQRALDAAHEREKEALASLRAATRRLEEAEDVYYSKSAYYSRQGADSGFLAPPEDALGEDDYALLTRRKEFLDKYPNLAEAPEEKRLACGGCALSRGGALCEEAPCLPGDALPGVIYLYKE